MNKALSIAASLPTPAGRYIGDSEARRPDAPQRVTIRRVSTDPRVSLAALRYRQASCPLASVPPLVISIRR